MTCQHTEGKGWSDKSGKALVDRHDCGYVEARNALLESAAGYADRRHPEPDTSECGPSKTKELREAWRNAWSRTYLRRVDHLWAEAHPTATEAEA